MLTNSIAYVYGLALEMTLVTDIVSQIVRYMLECTSSWLFVYLLEPRCFDYIVHDLEKICIAEYN